MSLKSLDALRDYAEQCCPEYEPYDTEMMRIADEIQAEIAERFMPMPVDADGVPIYVGDILDAPKGEEYGVVEVVELTFDGEDWYFKGEVPLSFMGLAGYFNTAGWRHYHKPRTIEDVLLDAGVSKACVEDVAAELRELMGGGE